MDIMFSNSRISVIRISGPTLPTSLKLKVPHKWSFFIVKVSFVSQMKNRCLSKYRWEIDPNMLQNYGQFLIRSLERSVVRPCDCRRGALFTSKQYLSTFYELTFVLLCRVHTLLSTLIRLKHFESRARQFVLLAWCPWIWHYLNSKRKFDWSLPSVQSVQSVSNTWCVGWTLFERQYLWKEAINVAVFSPNFDIR